VPFDHWISKRALVWKKYIWIKTGGRKYFFFFNSDDITIRVSSLQSYNHIYIRAKKCIGLKIGTRLKKNALLETILARPRQSYNNNNCSFSFSCFIFSSIIMPSCLLCSPSSEDCSTTWGFGYNDQQRCWILCIDPCAKLCFQEGIQVYRAGL